MYCPAIYGALVSSRIDELHRDARPVASPLTARAVEHEAHRCTSALATYFQPTMPGALVEEQA